MAFPVGMPAGYAAPSLFDAYAAVTSTTNQYTAIQKIQNNVLSVGYDLNQAVPLIVNLGTQQSVLTTSVAAVQTSVNSQVPKFSNYSAKLARIETKIDSIGGDGMNYQTAVLTGLLLVVIFAVTWKG